jgi:hypothetical protein
MARAVGLVLRQNLPEFQIVSQYYALAGFEPTLRGDLLVDRTTTFNNNFKHLAEMILENKRSHVVVVAHGMPDMGLIMPIASTTRVSVGYAMAKLAMLTDELQAKGSVDSQRLKNAATDWNLSQATITSLLQTCLKIRKTGDIGSVIHVRGCDIGAKLSHLRSMQRLFGASVVSAPDCAMFYVHLRPQTADAQATARTRTVLGRRFVYTRPGVSPFLIDIAYRGARADSYSAIAKLADLSHWKAHMYKKDSASANGHYIVAGLWPGDQAVYFLAHESGYPSRIRAVTAI